MSRKDRLIAVLAALPRGNQKIGAKELDQIANAIQIGAGLGQIAELPRAREATSKKAEAELMKYAELCRALGLHIQSMSRTALGLLEEHSLGSSFKCNTQRPQGIGCCDGQTIQAPQR